MGDGDNPAGSGCQCRSLGVAGEAGNFGFGRTRPRGSESRAGAYSVGGHWGFTRSHTSRWADLLERIPRM